MMAFPLRSTKVSRTIVLHRRLAIFLAATLVLVPACRNGARAREHVDKGNRLFAARQFASAESEYQQAIQINPDSGDAYFRLGLLQVDQEHPTAATQSLKRAVDLDPRNIEARLRLGDLLISSTQYAEAREQVEAVLRQDSKSAEAHRLLGQVALHQAQYADAELEFQQATLLDPHNPQPYEDLGLAQLLDAEYGAAEKTFQLAVNIRPEDPETYVNLANFYKTQNLMDRAEQTLQQGIAHNPRAVSLPIALAGLYQERERPADARRLLEATEKNTAGYPDGLRAVASFYLENGDPASALDRFLTLASRDPNDSSAPKKVAECYLQLHRWQDADQWLARQDRKDPDFRLLRARADMGAFRLREASSQLDSLIKDSPDQPAVYFYLAQVDTAEEQPALAQQALTEATKIQPGYLPGLLGLGNISLQQNNAAGALAYASQVIATSFWVTDAHLLAGGSYLLQGDLNQAQRAFELASGLSPRNPAPWERLARVYAARSDYANAEKFYATALSADPAYAPALSGLAETLAREGKSEEARVRIDRQIAAQPKSFQLYRAKAEFCISQKDWSCAERNYQQAIALNPYDVNGYLALAHIYAATNRPQPMIAAYEAARAKFPQYLPTYILLAQVYEYVGDIDRARQTCQDALKADPNSYQALSSLARLTADHGGSLGDALQLAEKAKALQPSDPAVDDALGWVYYKQGLYNSAVPALEAATAQSPQTGRFQLHLGLAYLAVNRPADAQTALQAALQAGLGPDEARLAQQAIQKSNR
jgi:tetratricopeptide (TPR) repeat protein